MNYHRIFLLSSIQILNKVAELPFKKKQKTGFLRHGFSV